ARAGPDVELVFQRARLTADDHVHAFPQVSIHDVRVSRYRAAPTRWIIAVEVADFARRTAGAFDVDAGIGAEETEVEHRAASPARVHERDHRRIRREVNREPGALRMKPRARI